LFRELELSGDSPSSLRPYLHGIRTLGCNGKPYQELSREDLIAWQYGLQHNGLSKTSIDMIKRFVRRFLRYCHNRSLSDKSTPSAIDCICCRRSRPDFQRDILSGEDVKAIISACQNQRDRALLFALYESGAGAGEICSLRVGM